MSRETAVGLLTKKIATIEGSMEVARNHADWLTAFMEYASYGEAPRHMYFWSGVAAIAGVLRRKVWIDQAYFKWHCNMYIVLVAPPGIVSKSTTAGVATRPPPTAIGATTTV